MELFFLFVVVLFLAYANGANDNFKGVATLFGSRTTGYRQALAWATVTTFAGSLTAIWVSQALVRAFSGKGLVPAIVAAEPAFLLAIGLGAALTIFLATLTGFPVSTTHALTGALVGAGWVAVGSQVNLGLLSQMFFLPLAVSPLLSLVITRIVYPVFRFAREQLGVTKELCLCDGLRRDPVLLKPDGALVLRASGVQLSVGERRQCVEQYRGVLLGIDCQWWLDRLHYLSAGMVSFARGLNDAPKIVALLVTAQALRLDVREGLLLVAISMAVGGLISARRVATTMSERITKMNHGQGFTANLVTSALVICASAFGFPVSTTHVSCGALFGIGIVNRQADGAVIRNIILSWIVTLPLAALLAGSLFRLL